MLRKYSARNCNFECQSAKTLQKCGCIPYYLPKNDTVRVCSRKDKCFARTRELIDKADGILKDVEGQSIDCDCLSLCFKIEYFFSITNSPLTLFRQTNYTGDFIRNNLAKAVIYFDSTTYSKVKKMPLYNFTDLIESSKGLNCGKSEEACMEKIKRDVDDFKNGSFLDGDCDCKPACFSIKFHRRMSKSPIWDTGLDRFRLSNNNTYESYTQRNCLLECQSTHTYAKCHCVPYYLPKNKSIKYCGKNEKECVAQAKQDMETVAGNGTSCHCLPACFSVKYPYGKSLSYLSRVVADDLGNISSDYFIKNMAAIHFFFYTSKFTSELKSELFGFTEILSNTGGLLSLFLGFSFLSLVELLYFISLRLFCDIATHRIRRNRKKKEAPVLEFLR